MLGTIVHVYDKKTLKEALFMFKCELKITEKGQKLLHFLCFLALLMNYEWLLSLKKIAFVVFY